MLAATLTSVAVVVVASCGSWTVHMATQHGDVSRRNAVTSHNCKMSSAVIQQRHTTTMHGMRFYMHNFHMLICYAKVSHLICYAKDFNNFRMQFFMTENPQKATVLERAGNSSKLFLPLEPMVKE